MGWSLATFEFNKARPKQLTFSSAHNSLVNDPGLNNYIGKYKSVSVT